MKKRVLSIAAFIILSCFSGFVCKANVSIPEIFTNHMVLQQNSEVKIWGWAKTGEKIKINTSWQTTEIQTDANTQGKWFVSIKTPKAGGPFQIKIKGNNEIILNDVFIGEVWLCSGQSNMEWTAAMGINNASEEIEKAKYPEIRFFSVYHATSENPQEHFKGEWVSCTPETMKNFSAIGYFFAQKLHTQLGVPIGIINSSWGGTPAESWMPEEIISNNIVLKNAATLQKPVPWGPVEPGRLYNAMIHPLIPFRIAGVLWYQGESNTINGNSYKEMLAGLINGWRGKWGYEFPFYFVQIAPYKYGKPNEGAIVRDMQRRVLDLPNTGMPVISDIGDTTDIHPRNKTDVAERLVNLALNRYYKTIEREDSGPLFENVLFKKDKAILSFNHAEGLNSQGKEPNCFEIAGSNKKYFPARAEISGQTVVLHSTQVKKPHFVRFAFGNTDTPNLFNKAGLPASTFTSEF